MTKSSRPTKGRDNVFEDLGFSPEEVRILTLKAQLAAFIVRVVNKRGLTQQQLGKMWVVPQPRVSEIMSGKLRLVSLERLIACLGEMGVEVSFHRKAMAATTKKLAG